MYEPTSVHTNLRVHVSKNERVSKSENPRTHLSCVHTVAHRVTSRLAYARARTRCAVLTL